MRHTADMEDETFFLPKLSSAASASYPPAGLRGTLYPVSLLYSVTHIYSLHFFEHYSIQI